MCAGALKPRGLVRRPAAARASLLSRQTVRVLAKTEDQVMCRQQFVNFFVTHVFADFDFTAQIDYCLYVNLLQALSLFKIYVTDVMAKATTT